MGQKKIGLGFWTLAQSPKEMKKRLGFWNNTSKPKGN